MPEISGDALGAELYKLVVVAQKYLPGIGEVYADNGDQVSEVEAIQGGARAFSGKTDFGSNWITLRGLYGNIMWETERNINDAASALQACVDDYSATDDEAAETLRKQINDHNAGNPSTADDYRITERATDRPA